MSITTHQRSRPLAVNFALILLLVRAAFFVTWNAVHFRWDLFSSVKFGTYLLMTLLPLWFIFRAKNWARWLLLAFALGGFCLSAPQLVQQFQAHAVSWLLMYLLLNLVVVVALVALFLPSSSLWFRGYTNANAG